MSPWRKSILYRCYGEDDRLLYVGVTYNWTARKSQHKKASKWFGEMVHHELENFTNRHDAEIAELRVIRSEKPKYNRVGADLPHMLDRGRISVQAWVELENREVPVPDGFITIVDEIYLRRAGTFH